MPSQEYYQSDRPTPPHYRHSQTDLTEWDESPHNHQQMPIHRRSGPPTDREAPLNGYQYRNGSKDKEDWEDVERPRRDGR